MEYRQFGTTEGRHHHPARAAWLMAQGLDIIPIPSSKSRKHLEENVKAAEVELTDEDLRRLDAILPYRAAAGNRTRDMKRVNV